MSSASSDRPLSIENPSFATRLLTASPRRPDAPRDVRTDQGEIVWSPPPDESIVTHYRVRLDRDTGAPDYQVPVGQRSLDSRAATVAFVSAFNATTGLESSFSTTGPVVPAGADGLIIPERTE